MKQSGRKGILVIVCIVLALAVAAAAWFATNDLRLYAQGSRLLEEGEYEQAAAVFESIPDYRDASILLLDARYGIACRHRDAGQLQEAAELFAALGNHRDSLEQKGVCFYDLATKARLQKDYETAHKQFESAGDYRDAATQAQRMLYRLGHEAFLEKDLDTAQQWFSKLDGEPQDYGTAHFATLAEAKDYLMEQFASHNTMVSIHVAQEPDLEFYQGLKNVYPVMYMLPAYFAEDMLWTISGITYYPADRILTAWEQGDTSALSQDERQTLETALEVVEQAKQEAADIHGVQQYLHDWLCQQVTYESPNMDVKRVEYIVLRELSCIGAILDGKANCQGYADAFYLLGRLAGLEVGKLFGDTDGGHVWNTVTFDGVSYITDVTFDDLSDEEYDGWHYTYYNVFLDPEVYAVYGGPEMAPELAQGPDMPHNYFAQHDLCFATVQEAADSLVSQNYDHGKLWAYAMVEGKVLTVDETARILRNSVYRRGARSVSWTHWAMAYGENTFLIVCWEF